MPASLDTLPTGVCVAIASRLRAHDVRNHSRTSSGHVRLSFRNVYVRHYARLRVPLDDQSCEAFVAACQRAIASSRPLPTHVALAPPTQLKVLQTIGIHGTIDAIELEPTRSFRSVKAVQESVWYELGGLTSIPRLVHLTIVGWYLHTTIDVAILADAAPQLQVFSAKEITLKNGDAFRRLGCRSRLVLEIVKIDSFKFAVDHPSPEEFQCEGIYLEDDTDYSQWRPLKTLDLSWVSSLLSQFLRAVEQTHLPRLETLRVVPDDDLHKFEVDLTAQPSPHLRELTNPLRAVQGGMATITALTNLRHLELCWENDVNESSTEVAGLDDAAPLAHLVQLETLKLRMGYSATTCRLLRALCRRCELHLVDGWLGDCTDYLPRLEKLEVDELGVKPRQRTFQLRFDEDGGGDGCGLQHRPRLRGV